MKEEFWDAFLFLQKNGSFSLSFSLFSLSFFSFLFLFFSLSFFSFFLNIFSLNSRGRKTFPAVIDMFGSVGGLVEHRSALLGKFHYSFHYTKNFFFIFFI